MCCLFTTCTGYAQKRGVFSLDFEPVTYGIKTHNLYGTYLGEFLGGKVGPAGY